MILPFSKIVGGKYEILEKLREGGMGAIYKVRHRLLDELMVIKIIRPQLAFDDDLQSRFLKEAKSAIRLNHPNISRVHDFAIEPEAGVAYLVMEFIDGVSLQDILQESGPPSFKLSLEIGSQCLGALSYLHSQGLIHRDVAPDNFMLVADERQEPLVKLIDLGIVRPESGSQGTALSVFLGKYAYASPEQFRAPEEGSHKLDHRSDIYSFGIVLYQLLTGRLPVPGSDLATWAYGHNHLPPLDFDQTDTAGRVPEGVRRLVMCALEKEPSDRVSSAAEFAKVLSGFRVGESHAHEVAQIMSLSPRRVRNGQKHQKSGSTQEHVDQKFSADSTTAKTLIQDALRDSQRRPNHPEAAELLHEVELAAAQQEAALPRDRAIELAASRIRALISEGDLDRADETLFAIKGIYGEHAELQRLLDQTRAERERLALIAQLAQLVSQVRTKRANGDFRGAVALLRQALHQDADNSEIRILLARTQLDLRLQDEQRARLALVSETRARIEEYVERGELTEADAALTRLEYQHGATEELEALRVRLQMLRRERERAKLASHLRQAQRLRDEDHLQESVEEARKALALDPQNREATTLVDSLILEIEERELKAAARRDAAHLDALLDRGRLLRAELLIRSSRREYGNLPALQDQLQRCRRLRTTRWAGRWAKVQELGRSIPVDRFRTLTSSGWAHASHTAGALAERIRLRLLRAELLIRSSRREYGNLPALQDRLQRCRRLRTTRWAGRWAKVQELGRSIPVDRFRTLTSRGWAHASHTAGALVEWIRLRIEAWSKVRTWVLVASVSLVVLAIAGSYLANVRGQRESDVAHLDDAPIDEKTSGVDPDTAATVASRGDLILDALPWGRVVSIVGREGEPQKLGESLFTPVRLSLPAGVYRVALESPAVEKPAEFWVQVLRSRVTTKVHEFEPFDADAYFEKARQ